MKTVAFISCALLSLTCYSAENAKTTDTPTADVAVNEATPVPATAVVIFRVPLGSGTPGFQSAEQATYVGDGLWHAPQYMPMYPTAGVIWPRVIDVSCVKSQAQYICDGYNWLPALGRGEYLLIRPSVKPEVKPVQPQIQERIIYKEVPAKPKKQ